MNTNHLRVLIIGINYAPEPTGNAPYTAGLAEHLVHRGIETTAVTAMPYYPSWRVASGYDSRLQMREQLNGVDVVRYRQHIPQRQSASQRALFEGSFFLHGLLSLGLPRPNVILGVMPSVSGGGLAALASQRYGVPFGLLIQDLSGRAAQQSGIPGGGSVARLVRRLEGWSSRRAAAIAIVAEGFRPYLEELGVAPERIRRVRNWTHVGQANRGRSETRARLGLPESAYVCLHAGNMGYKQGLENLVDCARLARVADPSLLFVLMGDGNQRAELEKQGAGLPNLRFLPAQSDEEFPNALAAADVLLVNQRLAVTDMSLPGKLTSYFASGRPVVAAVAPESETSLELRESGGGVRVDAGQPEALLAAIRSLAANHEEADALGRRGQMHARAHLSADAALANLERFILEIAGTPDRDSVMPSQTAARRSSFSRPSVSH